MKVLVLLLGGGLAFAQTAPTSYTITEIHSFDGPPGESLVISRSGSKAMIEINGKTRSVLDLDSHAQYGWSTPVTPDGGCSIGKWKGDWGDPFSGGEEFKGELAKAGGKVVGNETVNGVAAQVSEASMPDGSKARMWIDPKLGLVLKIQSTDKAGKTMNLIEVKSVSLAKPPDSTFVIPSSCQPPAVDPDFAVATTGPASQDACVVMVRVVKAGTMEPIKTGFHMGIDLSVNQLHPQDHTVGMGQDGKPVFGGGGIRDMTVQFKDGVLRLGKIAGMFDIETAWDNNAGFASGMMYRKCFGPTTMLLMVVKDPTTLGKGVDWLWDKKGKYLPAGQ